MKFFVFIFSFYILALSCLPCGDRQECNVKAEQKITASTPHQEHQHQTEACTPFCSCACCAAASFHQPVMYAKTNGLVFQKLTFYYNDDFLSYDFHSIWQPPRIS